MRISFDLDETLISASDSWQVEPDLPGFRDDRERLRLGTSQLFRWLRSEGHEIWIYTNSYRGFKDLARWFTACRLPVDEVINQIKHDEKRFELDPRVRVDKNPAWFDIDLHFDDLIELSSDSRIEIIDPSDSEWVARVMQIVGQKQQ